MAHGASALQVVAFALIAQVNVVRVPLAQCFTIQSIAQSSVRAILSKTLDRDTIRAMGGGLYGYCNQGSRRQDFPAPLGHPLPLALHGLRSHHVRPACCRNMRNTTPSSKIFDHETAAYFASLGSSAFL